MSPPARPDLAELRQRAKPFALTGDGVALPVDLIVQACKDRDTLLDYATQLETLMEEAVKVILDLDHFTFFAVHEPGCGEPCDCGWDELSERRIPALGQKYQALLSPSGSPEPQK